MKILFASAEVAPFAKVGGLGDVAGSLPLSIREMHNDIRIIMPLYGSIDLEKYQIKDVENSEILITCGEKEIPVSLMQCYLPHSDLVVYFVKNDEYFGNLNDVYPHNISPRFEQERYIVFATAVLNLMEMIDFIPDLIHCNDWHTASIPVLMKTKFSEFKKTKSVYTIHNLAYQGKYGREILDFAGINNDDIYHSVEFDGCVNWMKAAFVYSDRISTVSKTYAKEILTPQYGERLENILNDSKNKLVGIVNGIDYSVWNPIKDKNIPSRYNSFFMRGKQVCKKHLKIEYGLDAFSNAPVIAIVSRLVEQKGFDLVLNIVEELKNLNVNIVILGSGDEKYENELINIQQKSSNIKVKIGYNAVLSDKLYAGSDMFLMPSRFEPCGLGQLIALKYGSIPIVRDTGGLSDTIVDYNTDKSNGNGFKFYNYSSEELLDAIKSACSVYNNKKEWKKLVTKAMKCDFSWANSAKQYLEMYKSI